MLKKAADILNHYANLIVAIATVAIAILTFILARMAIQQTDVTMQALELSSRPFIDITAWPQTISKTRPGERMRMKIDMRNFGGIPTDVKVKGIIIYSSKKLSTPPLDKGGEDIHTVFPKNPSVASGFIYSVDPMTEGQIKDMTAGTGYVYIRVLGTYGKYHTEICSEIPLRASASGAMFTADIADVNRCEDPTTNNAN